MINALTESSVARTGKNGGTTKMLHFYALKPKKPAGYLVDGPGYGKFVRQLYSRTKKEQFDPENE